MFELLEGPFPGISAARHQAAAFGAPWESASTPFVVEVDGELVTHVGLLELPLHVDGAPLVAGGVHGVATRASARRRGHFRAAIEELLGFAADRYGTLLLTTLHPEYFEAFGFEVVPEHVFTRALDGTFTRALDGTFTRALDGTFTRALDGKVGGGRRPARRLDARRPADRELLHRLLAARSPVSDVLGIGPERVVWAFYEAGADLRHLGDLDVVVSAEQAGTSLRLYDVVGAEVPPVEAIVAAWGAPVDRVVAFFSPDRLGGAWEAGPPDLTGGPDALEPGEPNTVLMARGPLGRDRPRMLPRPGRC